MKIAVMGSNSFIASHLIELLKEKGHGVIGLQRHVGNTLLGDEDIKADVTYLGDIKDKNLVYKAISLSDGVINLAGILGTQETVNNPYPSIESNIVGAVNVLEAVREFGVPFVQIAVGNYKEINTYSITKTTAEKLTLMYAREHGVKGNVVRALNAFGERQKYYPVRKMMPSFSMRALNNEPLQVYGDGSQEMDFVYVKDVAGVLYSALLHAKTGLVGHIFEAGTGVGLSVRQWAEKVIKLSNSNSKIEYLPMRPGETIGSRVVAENPYDYPYSNVDEVLKKTIEWYRNVQE